MNLQDLLDLPHKDGIKIEDWEIVHSNLRVLAYELIEYTKSRNLPLVITSLIRPKIPGVSKTDIHAKGRAFDISVNGWTIDDCLMCEKYFNENYDKIGAISQETGLPRACLYENPLYNGKGRGAHLHYQVKP